MRSVGWTRTSSSPSPAPSSPPLIGVNAECSALPNEVETSEPVLLLLVGGGGGGAVVRFVCRSSLSAVAAAAAAVNVADNANK